jgi:prolyl oligopeptidase
MPVTAKYLNQRAYLHRLGSNPDDDAALFGAGVVPGIALEPVENVAAGHVPGSSYVFALIVNGVQREAKLYAAPLASLAGDKTPWRKIVDYSDGVTDLAIHGDTIYLLSHNGAPHSRCSGRLADVIATPKSSFPKATTSSPASPARRMRCMSAA